MYQLTYTEITNDVQVDVSPVYIEEESDPIARKHAFAYFITIRNLGTSRVQLLKRHWEIREENGEQYEVDGEGVVGKKPVLEPGESHKYNSFCVLKGYLGSMTGYYIMEREDGAMLKVGIPSFLLRSHLLN